MPRRPLTPLQIELIERHRQQSGRAAMTAVALEQTAPTSLDVDAIWAKWNSPPAASLREQTGTAPGAAARAQPRGNLAGLERTEGGGLTMDFASLLYNPVYDVLGREATLTVDALSDPLTITAMDKTAGIEVGDDKTQIQTVQPAATVRMADITAAGLTRRELKDGTLEINGTTWRIASTRPKPSPNGEAEGELLLLLYEA